MTDKRIPDAWLHQVADGDGEPDMALSFAEDSFPFDGVCGYRSLSRRPLYTTPPSVDALIAEIERLSKPYVPMTDDDWCEAIDGETRLFHGANIGFCKIVERIVIKRAGLEIKHD